MAENTRIEWADHTHNAWVGCTKVGPGCDHCYAETLAKRTGYVEWGPGKPRRRTTEANWELPKKWNAQARDQRRRFRVFANSLSDVFDNEVPTQWRADLFDLVDKTPYLDWLILTKRIGNVPVMMREIQRSGAMPRNVWLGATVVDQQEADRDIPKLLVTQARVRFLSMEPLLAPVNLGRFLWACCGNLVQGADYMDQQEEICCGEPMAREQLHWVIAGGESGHGARPVHPGWIRSIRDQCAAAGVPFLFKQWGDWIPSEAEEQPVFRGAHQYLGNGAYAYRIGKKAAGRELDGVTHDGYPEVSP